MMSFLFNCGACCMILSIWAIIQLLLMGIFYKMETLVLLEQASPEEFVDIEDFIKQTKDNYAVIALYCWIVAGMYAVTFCLSLLCLRQARKMARAQEKLRDDDETACNPPPLRAKRKCFK